MAKTAKKPNKGKPIEVPFGDKLILFRYFLDCLGAESLPRLSAELNSTDYEGINDSGNTFFFGYLSALPTLKISKDTLKVYDENICRYVNQIGGNRGGIRLKYFQYIACLFTEMYLDRYFADVNAFAADLNAFADNIKARSNGLIDIAPFEPKNMNKLAFMCATGSGKTLIMHINISQYKHYLKKARTLNPNININKTIVLAPNEGMSNQHLAELELSHINAEMFAKNSFGGKDIVVIDMNKLKEDGKVKTVSVDSFEGNNLVLVDEAHRGLATGEVWYNYRSRLSADYANGGFAFEYSATLKQAMRGSSNVNKEILDEYYRSIIIDYSYKYFYEDGYGKEYRIYNLRDNIVEEQRQLYLVGCLLSFYQQLKLFLEKKTAFAPFHIEKPLLVFVGNRVTATPSKAEMTDVEEVLTFIDNFVRNKEKTVGQINEILRGNTGLMNTQGKDLFSQSFLTLSSLFGKTLSGENVYADVLRLVFNNTSQSDSSCLHVVNLKQVSGEIALRIGTDGDYFGVISIGKTAELIKLLELKGIFCGSDEFLKDSLFRNINDKTSEIKMLIGSRKFTEGWNSWRVSTMGLINFAKGEGSQAIQLFGRGVRLRGYNMNLKRSGKIGAVSAPKNIDLLETLTIFGIKAQYMEDFKKYFELEDIVDVYKYTLSVVSRYDEKLHKKLRVINVRDGANFKKQAARLVLRVPEKDSEFARYINKYKVEIDCRSKVQSLDSTLNLEMDAALEEHTLPSEYLPWLDYERIIRELEIYKNEKFYYNITLSKSALIDILSLDGWYSLLIPKEHFEIKSIARLELSTDFAVMVLKKYIEKYFKFEKGKWEESRLEYQELSEDDNNFIDEYNFTTENGEIGTTLEDFVGNLQTLLKKESGLSEQIHAFNNSNALIAFDFRFHLYTPLIHLQAGNLQLSVSPVSLNKDEKKFVDLLSAYVENNLSKFSGNDLYLLRNKSMAGMGFFEVGYFYPDYILWLDTPDTQFISFIDPKGLLHIGWTDPKIEFYSRIKRTESALQPTSGQNVVLNSFIMSGTSSANLDGWWRKDNGSAVTKQERHSKHVFCLDEGEDCIRGMFEKMCKREKI